MASSRFKLVFFSPRTETQTILSHLFSFNLPSSGKPTVGKIGNYSSCAFVSPGKGQFLPGEEATPTIGKVGVPEFVEEDRVEVVVSGTRDDVRCIVDELKKCHSYEEVACDVYRLEDF